MDNYSDTMRIDLPVADTTFRRECSCRECYLLLYPKHMEYKVVAEYSELDKDSLLWEDKVANYRWSSTRKGLSRVDMMYDNKEGMWSVDIEFKGVSNTTGWFFESPSAAIKVYNILTKYMTGFLYKETTPITAPNVERSVATDGKSE